MKHFFYLIFLCFCLPAGLGAQQVIFSENFDNYQQINFSGQWGSIGNSGSYQWTCDIPYILGTICFPNTGNITKAAGISDIAGSACDFDHNDSNVLLFTPLIHIPNVSGAVFKYDSYFTGKVVNGVAETATIEVSTDTGATWTVLQSPQLASGPQMTTGYVNLAAYINTPSIRLGFRYGDKGQKMTGWILDNFKVYVPAPIDLSITQLNPVDSMARYFSLNDSFAVSAVIMNNGSQPITAYQFNYQYGNGPVVSIPVTGVNIAPFTSVNYQYPQRLAVTSIGRKELKAWIVAAGDTVHSNDSASIGISCVAFYPKKTVLVEHGTGNWEPFAPQGYVFMDKLKAGDNPPAVVALHDQDIMMGDLAYPHYLEDLNHYYVPFFLYDRTTNIPATVIKKIVNGSGTHVYAVFDTTLFFDTYNQVKQHFGFASIDLDPQAFDYKIDITATVTPAVAMNGDYRLALILTEDKLQGTGTQWLQANGYAGGTNGAMGGYESLPDPVPAASMVYNYVARSITPNPTGNTGSLPSVMQPNTPYTCKLSANINSAWNFRNMKAIVALMYYSATDSGVLNCAQTDIPAVGVANVFGPKSTVRVYPNPAGDNTNLLLELEKNSNVTITVSDIMGNMLYRTEYLDLQSGDHQFVVPSRNWASGFYFVNVGDGHAKQTLKLEVVH